MKYNLRILKNKNLFKRHKCSSINALNIKYFWTTTTAIGVFWVLLNYPILNFKKTSRCGTVLISNFITVRLVTQCGKNIG